MMVAIRLLLIRLGLRRPTLGDAFDRLMQHRKPNVEVEAPEGSPRTTG